MVVTGVFCEIPQRKHDKLYGFNRFFVLEVADDCLKVVNEQLHVFNATESQKVVSFKIRPPEEFPLPQNTKERDQTIKALVLITGLNTDWAEMYLFGAKLSFYYYFFCRLLQECSFDLKQALLLFVDMYQRNKIPQIGFRN